jgi:DNA-binding IclR family transcriptional regulator
MSEEDFSNFPPAVERTLAILDYLGSSDGPKSIKEITKALSIPSASAYRIIGCLVKYGYLQEDIVYPDKYNLGYKLYVLGRNAFGDTNLSEIARPYMEKLAAQTGQACQLAVLSVNAAVTIDQVLPLSGITVIAKLGDKVPVNISAAGKILTSYLLKDKQEQFLNNAWKIVRKNTTHTIDDIQAFRSELQRTQINGYGTDYEEYSIGIGCLALPILDENQNPIAAIGLTGHIGNYKDKDNFSIFLDSLKEAAVLISNQLCTHFK